MESAPVTPTTPTVQDTTHEAAQTTAEETSVAKAKSPSVGRWMTLTTSISNTANHKIDITIGRLTFIISIVAMIVAVLSYSYGAASYHLAQSAYRLQQLEFCKEHGDDPQVVASNHCQHLIHKPIDTMIEERAVALDGLEQAIADVDVSASVGGLEEVGQVFKTCRNANPFVFSSQCPRRLTSKGLSRIMQE
ncbi:MAG: hypothetical protein Q9215_008071 [Flavoplaca cf. flavocitrina]